MAILSHEHHHWAYNWIPIFTAFIWFSVLLSMILTWASLLVLLPRIQQLILGL